MKWGDMVRYQQAEQKTQTEGYARRETPRTLALFRNKNVTVDKLERLLGSWYWESQQELTYANSFKIRRMMTRNEDNWHTFFSELQAYIEDHGHLPDKHVAENRGLLSKAKYLRKKIKARMTDDGMVGRFYEILEMRTKEYIGGK